MTKFYTDIKEFNTISSSSLPANVTSIYFLDSMLKEFKNVRYFRVYVSNSQNYTRKVADKIVFDYRIMHSRVDLANKCDPEFLKECANIFSNIGVYREDLFHEKPYFEIFAKDLCNKLNYYKAELDPESDEYLTVIEILIVLGSKLEKDNSTMLIIMKR